MEKIKLQEELLKYKEQCEELKEMLTRSNIEQTLWQDREKRAKDRYEKVCQELELMLTSKNQEIRHLNKKVSDLSFRLLESEQAREELKGMNSEACAAVINKLKNEIISFESTKMVSDKAMEELEGKNLEALRTIEEFKHLVVAANRAFEEKNKKWEVLKIKMNDIGNTGVKESIGVNSLSNGRRTTFLTSTQRNEDGGRNDDDTPDQASSLRSSSSNLDKGTKNSKGPGPVEVANSVVKAKPGRSAYLSDLLANLDEEKIGEPPSPPLITYFMRSKRSTFGNSVDNLPSKIHKKARTRLPRHERVSQS